MDLYHHIEPASELVSLALLSGFSATNGIDGFGLVNRVAVA